MKNISKNKTGNVNKNAQTALAEINAQIEALNLQRVALATPLKSRHAELRAGLLALEMEIRSLDNAWRPGSLRPKADDKIREVITAHGKPMTPDEIVTAVGDQFTPWKVKSVLKKRSSGAKAVFALSDGKYSLKAGS